ncbi:alpha-mannosidase, partial [Geitlerinema sp. P-1104]|nr:alpha-mannosidase [Geitlerinema sp. P-1104]
MEQAWKGVLFNQFHDILPGSTIPEVLREANQVSAAGLSQAQEIRDDAITQLLQQLPSVTPPHPEAILVSVVNSLTWGRSHLVSLSLPSSHPNWRICSLSGEPLPSQRFQDQLRFLAQDVPGVGCCRYWLYPDKEAPQDNSSYHTTRAPILENANLRVTIDEETGNIRGIYNKQTQQQVLNLLGGNCLEAYSDKGQYWDAWNIDPKYEQHPLPPPTLEQLEWLEWGELRQRLRVVRRLGNSRICQDYCLDKQASILVINTDIDWQEQQVLLKTAFHVNFWAEMATYESPCGAIAR